MSTGQRSPEERKEILDTELAAHIRRGWKVESQSEFMVAVVWGKPVNHVLHLIVSLVTFGAMAAHMGDLGPRAGREAQDDSGRRVVCA